eukprot:3254178-Prymnesium_polylepis.1
MCNSHRVLSIVEGVIHARSCYPGILSERAPPGSTRKEELNAAVPMDDEAQGDEPNDEPDDARLDERHEQVVQIRSVLTADRVKALEAQEHQTRDAGLGLVPVDAPVDGEGGSQIKAQPRARVVNQDPDAVDDKIAVNVNVCCVAIECDIQKEEAVYDDLEYPQHAPALARKIDEGEAVRQGDRRVDQEGERDDIPREP